MGALSLVATGLNPYRRTFGSYLQRPDVSHRIGAVAHGIQTVAKTADTLSGERLSSAVKMLPAGNLLLKGANYVANNAEGIAKGAGSMLSR